MNLETVKVTILSTNIDEKSGTFEDDAGKERSYTTRKQKAKLEAGGFAYPYDVRLENGQQPFPLGEYLMDTAAMLAVNKAAHTFSRFPVLRPIEAPKARS